MGRVAKVLACAISSLLSCLSASNAVEICSARFIQPALYRKCMFAVIFKANVRNLVWTCREPIFSDSRDPMMIFSVSRDSIFNSRDPNRVPETLEKNPGVCNMDLVSADKIHHRHHNQLSTNFLGNT